MIVERVTCDSCDLIRINGIVCHEHGCPNARKGKVRECKECGTEFIPEEQYQVHCCEGCWQMYNRIYPDSPEQ